MACRLLASNLCASAQTAKVQDGIGFSSSLDQTAPGLTTAAVLQTSRFTDGSTSSSQQNGPYSANKPQKSQDPDFHKYMFDIGFGVPTSVGTTDKYQTYGFNFQTGFGRNLNRYVGVKLEYDFNYFNIPTTADTQNNTGDVLINSISIDPYLNLSPKSRVGLYLVGGGGYNWKTTQFTAPTGYEVCSPLNGCVLQSPVVASYSNDAFAMNIGCGINWRLAPFIIYAEARYVQVESQSSKVNSSNPYPPAYYSTDYIPITVGFRW